MRSGAQLRREGSDLGLWFGEAYAGYRSRVGNWLETKAPSIAPITRYRAETHNSPSARQAPRRAVRRLTHTQPWAHGAPMAVGNLAPLCRSIIFPPSTLTARRKEKTSHGHRLKHQAGWHLKRTGLTTYTWTSPLGQTDTTAGPSP